MEDRIRSKVARNIEGGSTIFGLDIVDLCIMFLLFEAGDMVFNIAVAFLLGLVSYGGLFYLRRRQAPGFLLHAGRWITEPRIFFGWVGRNERGDNVARRQFQFDIVDCHVAALRRDRG